MKVLKLRELPAPPRRSVCILIRCARSSWRSPLRASTGVRAAVTGGVDDPLVFDELVRADALVPPADAHMHTSTNSIARRHGRGHADRPPR